MEVATVPPASLPVHQPQANATLAMIERLVVDPNADIDKLERMIALQEKVLAKQAEAAFNQDLAVMQASLPCIAERGQIHDKVGNVQSTYGLWEDINRELLPVLSAHGFAISFRIDTSSGVTVTAVLSHRAGHSTTTSMTLPVDATGGKNGVQAVASSVSYGQRYTSRALLNYSTHNDPLDDDGQAAGSAAPEVEKSPFITKTQVHQIHQLIAEAGADEAGFLTWVKAPSVGQIASERYEGAVTLLKQKKAAKAKKESTQ